ncbi:MAG: NADH-quinone oxidoreductase subunit G [Proteobacteria bacterium]|nr:NADH-quinone oxidoreductase subunit G [Pseudomonadota bacterium]
MVKVTIDGQTTEMPKGSTIIQAAKKLGIEIPHFCYHERLSVAGNCRMCLVDLEGAPKPVASCAWPVADNMVVNTQSERTQNARKGVMEFLLINHPLDCPICDQGGECDLQDIAVSYGSDRTRFHEAKRAVADKDLGPLVETVMTRCIHCTRCIRFATEIAGVPEMGATGRGENMQVGTYVEQALASELSGNMIDLCPVGALTSKPYEFTARPWELKHTDSIDVMDALGSHIRIDHRDGKVMRVVPRECNEINEEWLSDAGRFSYDGLANNRLTHPMVRKGKKLTATTWQEAFAVIAEAAKGMRKNRIAGVAGNLLCAEDLYAFDHFMKDTLGTDNVDCRTNGLTIDGKVRAAYIMNTPIAELDKVDAVLLVGCNPRLEVPVLNARLRKGVLKRGMKVASIGAPVDLTYPVQTLGESPKLLDDILEGKHPFADVLREATNGVILVGARAVLTRPDSQQILDKAREVAEMYGFVRPDWNGFNVLHQATGRITGLDMGVYPQKDGYHSGGIAEAVKAGKIDLLVLHGESQRPASDFEGAKFTVFIGTHDSPYAQLADVVLPAAAYTEKAGLWANVEGRVQEGHMAVRPPMEAKEDWKIYRALSEVLGSKLPFDNQTQLRALIAKLNKAYAPENIGKVTRADWKHFGMSGSVREEGLSTSVPAYYLSNEIMRASKVMRDCQDLADARAAQTMKKAS